MIENYDGNLPCIKQSDFVAEQNIKEEEKVAVAIAKERNGASKIKTQP